MADDKELKPSVESALASFEAWKGSPSGLSALGFGKIGPVVGGNEALKAAQEEAARKT